MRTTNIAQGVVYRYKDAGLEFLIIKRVPSDGGFWQAITGTIEDGEDATQTLIRELAEEAGITTTLHVSDCLEIYNWESTEYELMGKDHVFAVEVGDSTDIVINSEEHSEFRWLALDDAAKLLKFDGNKQSMKTVSKYANERQQTKFLYSIPVTDSGLTIGASIAIQMGALASRQTTILRTRCNHPDGRDENVAEHSLMLAKVAPELSRLLYPELDENLVARFATLHDDIEAYVGDTPTDALSNLDQDAKRRLETKGLKQLLKEYAHMPGYAKFMTEYEDQSVPEARFIRAVDKLMVLLIHMPNQAAILKANYSYDSFLKSERDLIKRDLYKYGEFDKIVELRREIGLELANKYLRHHIDSANMS